MNLLYFYGGVILVEFLWLCFVLLLIIVFGLYFFEMVRCVLVLLNVYVVVFKSVDLCDMCIVIVVVMCGECVVVLVEFVLLCWFGKLILR